MKKIIKLHNKQILPSKSGIVSEQNLRLAKEIFLQNAIEQLLDFVKVDYEYPTDDSQELQFSINVRVEEELSLNRIVNQRFYD